MITQFYFNMTFLLRVISRYYLNSRVDNTNIYLQYRILNIFSGIVCFYEIESRYDRSVIRVNKQVT